MKKLPAILILALLILSMGGYFFLFSALKYEANRQLEKSLDKGIYDL